MTVGALIAAIALVVAYVVVTRWLLPRFGIKK
jgi:hypothetical protein